jgi:hypothetical protein
VQGAGLVERGPRRGGGGRPTVDAVKGKVKELDDAYRTLIRELSA